MDCRYFGVLIAYLITNSEGTRGCDFYCCEGDRTAFVEAGWQNCCSEEQCSEAFQRPTDWVKIAETRREYYRPQPCNVQCCRGRSRNSNLTCCADQICRALSTMDSMTLDELYAQDLVQNQHQLQGLEWGVTESWVSFGKNSSHSSLYHLANIVFPWHQTTTEDPEETKRKQQIADKPTQDTRSDSGDLIMKIFLGCVGLIAFVLGLWCRLWRCQRKMERRAQLDAWMAGGGAANQASAAAPLVAVTVVPVTESPERLNETGVISSNNLPPSYEEVAYSTAVDVLPEKRLS